MDFLEKDLEEIIFSSDREKLSERGLCLEGKAFRQLRIGNYGIADIVTFERVGYYQLEVKVIELKKDKIGISAFLQALSYVKGIQRYFEKKCPKMVLWYKIALIGKEVDESGSLCYLPDLIDSRAPDVLTGLTFYTYSYSLNGIEFEGRHSYKLTDEGF